MTIMVERPGSASGAIDTGRRMARCFPMPAEQEFVGLVTTLVTRFFAQNGRDLTAVEGEPLAGRLSALIMERGLPRALAEGELGSPGGMSDEACAPLVARLVAGSKDDLLADTARQLIKACFYPEFKVCRDSYRAAGPDGRCRRQELARVRARVSGSHCVDCPHWVALDPAAHQGLLVEAWRGAWREYVENTGIFLPEDFRALRRYLHNQVHQR